MNFERICCSHFDSKMPHSEFYRSVDGKNESPLQKANDISYIPNDEFVELVWEKGQIMMQGQSSKAKKTPVSSNFQFHTSKVHEKGLLDASMPGTSVEMGLNEDDDMVPWLNYPLDDYCSDLLPEISGVTVNEPSTCYGLNAMRGNCNQINKDSHSHTHSVSLHHGASLDQPNTSKVPSSSRTSHLFSWSLDQVRIPDPQVRSGVSDIGSSSARSKPHNIIHRDSIQSEGSSGRLEKMMQKQDSLLPYSSSNSLNFSHFSRPAAMARANVQNNGLVADLGSCGLDIMKNNEHHAALNVVNHVLEKESGFPGQPSLDSGKVASNPFIGKPPEEPHCVEKSCTDRREDATNNDKSPNVVLDANAPKGDPDTEKSIEPMGASSSVCSGNSAERASNDLSKNLKRKSRDTEDFECQSQDIREEPLGTKTAATSQGGTGSKRSRAAEVHNLSERRRRDRINEKMRALQELIPNCNKVDKASMLDEAIEYLKTLQLQVQIMSMGAGLCMPPMMFPTGMQHMHPAHVPHFSPMGIGMGMGYGMGMGMGMAEMNGGSGVHPHMFPFPPTTQGSRYPVPSSPISGVDSCQGIPRSTFQVYGHPGQGMPMLFPQPPIPRFPTNAAIQRMGTHVEVPDLAPSSKDPMQNKNHHVMTQTSGQFQVANESLNRSISLNKKDHVVEAACSTAGVD